MDPKKTQEFYNVEIWLRDFSRNKNCSFLLLSLTLLLSQPAFNFYKIFDVKNLIYRRVYAAIIKQVQFGNGYT